jgi:DTW domain-containing protein YfiP
MSSCMCKYLTTITTKTKFVLLMHDHEFRKIKNGTGHFTHLSLENSELHIGIDFSDHRRVNELINDQNNICYVLYPSNESLVLNQTRLYSEAKQNVVFLIDATWACSKKMLRLSTNLRQLPKVSFEHNKSSEFKIKEQPKELCLSTIESTLCVLELLNKNGDEKIVQEELDSFLNPFREMVTYQLECIGADTNAPRFKTDRVK